MPKEKRWKTVMKYAAGSLILAVAVGLAWFGPEWYANWQDARRMGQVRLSGREDIRFLDVASLDLEGRLKVLGESAYADLVYDSYYYVEVADELEKARKNVELWAENELLPEWTPAIVREDCLGEIRIYGVVLDESVLLPLCLLRFMDDSGALTVVLDGEMDIMYYAAVAGEDAEVYLLRCLGFRSAEELERSINEGQPQSLEEFLNGIYEKGEEELRESVSHYDFAAVCGANSVSVDRTDGWVDLDVELEFDSFTGYAGRRMVDGDNGVGIAVFFGREDWFVTTILEESGYYERITSAEELFWENDWGIEEMNIAQ